jgi:hypothetical protein
MDLEPQRVIEFRGLQKLCDDNVPCQERQELLDSLGVQSFTVPEHQIVFESLRALFPRGPISEERLRVHLNNRGFPDTDVEKYFRPASAPGSPQEPAKRTAR